MSLFPTHNNSISSTKKNSKIIFPARVKDILLSNEQNLFNELNGWGGLGYIKFKPLYSSIDNEIESTLIAKPLFSNIKQFPLKEEIILIILAPSFELNERSESNSYYYFPYPLNIWNNNHHNALPDNVNYDFEPKELNLGSNFKENENIKTLLPEEGDTIIEGRFGNSIRMSSTSKNKKISQNPWSGEGENGDPIIMIRNGQKIINNEPWIPDYEDINEDKSSLYLTSTQLIPINLSCLNLQSFDLNITNTFNPSLQILNNV